MPFAVYADPASMLRLSGELDAAGASTLASALDPLTARGVMGLDLAELTFMDSTGIKALCQAPQRLGGYGRVVLFNRSPFVLRVIDIAGPPQAAAEPILSHAIDRTHPEHHARDPRRPSFSACCWASERR